MKWTNYPDEDSWELEHMLLQDGCKPTIDEYWLRTGGNPAQDFHPDPDGKRRCWVCGWTSKSNDARYLKAHLTRTNHKWSTKRAHLTAKKDVKRDKLKERQDSLPKVRWGEQEVSNCWLFKYLGSLFTPDGSQEEDVCSRIAQAKTRAGKMRNIWKEEIILQLKLRLYKSAVCSILVYGAEAWRLDERTIRMLNGANAAMLTHITGKTRHEEATPETRTFDIISWIRSRRLRWLGHILRLPEENKSLLKEAVKHIYEHAQEGDLCMDAPIANDWERLKALASDRSSWRKRVNDLKVKMTKIKQPCRKQSTRSQRLSPLKIKRREQLRKKHFAAVKKTLSKNLQQTDIRAYFKPAKPKIDNSGGGAAAAFAAAARQNKNANVKYTFVPKEPKRKKGLDGGVRKKQKKVKKKTDEEAREAHYQRLKGEKTFLGCKWPTEAAEDTDSTVTITGAEATTIHTTHIQHKHITQHHI